MMERNGGARRKRTYPICLACHALVVMTIKRQLLLAVGPVFGVVHVQHDDLWRPGVTGDKGLGQPMGQADLLVNAPPSKSARTVKSPKGE
jgi:hypothetical protein